MTTVHAGQERMIAAVRLMERAITEIEGAAAEQRAARTEAAREKTAALNRKAAELAASPTVAVSRKWLRELAQAIYDARNDPRGIGEICDAIAEAAGGREAA
jgi:hypothetical protein